MRTLRRPWRHWFGPIARTQRRLAKEHIDWLVREGRITRDDKYVEGRDGWLYLADDSNDVLAQHAGRRLLSADDLEQWSAVIEQRAVRLGERDCGYAVLVAPDTHSVYPEHLPAGAKHGGRRPVRQLIDRLEHSVSPVRFVYPLDQMAGQKSTKLVCSPIDSHWTDFGAFVGYSALVDALSETVEVRRLTLADVCFFDMIGGGDLGSKLDPMRLEVHPVAIVRYPQARLLYDNCIENTGSLLITECRVAPSTTCLLLGDSYSYSFIKFLSESFGRVVLAHSPSLDWELVEQFEPDVVVSLTAERFLVEVPEDEGFRLSAHEISKRESRRTRPPLVHWFRSPRWPSPAEAETLRAHFLSTGNVRDATIVSVLAYGGLLPQELTALRWPDVRDDELVIRRRGARVGERTPARRVPMIGPLADDLRDWKELQSPSRPRELVFPGVADLHWAGAEWSTWRRDVFDPAVLACGLDLKRPHDLRHTFCTLALHAGMPTKALAKRIGVDAEEIRRIYGSLADTLKAWEPVEPARLVRSARRALTVEPLEIA